MRCSIALYVLAAIVRLIYVSQGYDVPPQDTRDYDDIALNLLAGEGFVARENWFGFEVRSWRAPFYPLFLAAVYGIAGYSHEAVRVVQCLVGSGTVVLVYLIARALGRREAWVAGVLAAVYGPLVSISNEVMTETWFCFFQTLSVYALIRYGKQHQVKWGLIGGISIGLSALTRPVGLLILPAYALVVLWRNRRDWRPIVTVVGAVLLITVPWTIRNYAVHGVWPVFSTHGGFILSRSNGDTPDWRRPDGWQIERARFEQTPSEVERDRLWFREGVATIVADPVQYARWSVERFVRFWYVFRPDYNLWFVLVLPFTVTGIVRFGTTDGFRLMTVVIAMSVATFSLILYGSTRFRLPLEPMFIVFASTWCADFVTRRGRSAVWILSSYAALNLVVKLNEETLRSSLLAVLKSVGLK